MSGGTFDYIQYRLDDAVERIEQEIESNTAKPEYWYGEWDGQVYSDETITEFRKGIGIIKRAEVYMQRIDWLLAGDDGEESFHKRLKEDLDELNSTTMSKIAEKRTNEIVGEYHDGDYTDHSRQNTQWVAFKQGYSQAMQDFMEKSEEFLYLQLNNGSIECGNIERLIDDFKNYMQDEM